MKTAIIIPAYNEELTIRETIADYHAQLPAAEFIIVDNNSSDRTGEFARSAITGLGCRGSVLFERRQGKANAIRKAFRETDADIYVMTDADLTYPASEIEKLMAPVLSGEADMAVGDRLTAGNYARENKRPFHNLGNSLVKDLENQLVAADLKDIMSGCRVFNRFFVKNYPILSSGFELETELTLHALDKRFLITEIPVEYKDRPAGSFSKLNTVGDGMRVIKTIFSIFKEYRPLLFFSTAAAVFCALGLAVGIPPILEFMRFHFVYKVPSAILATGFMIFSLLCFSVGLILDVVAKNHRHNYELQLLRFVEHARAIPSR